MRKNFIIPMLLAILIGFFSAKFVFVEKTEREEDYYNAYFLQQGVYTNRDVIDKYIKDRNAIVLKEDNKYYVYLGVTTDRDNASKLKKIYDSNNQELYIKKTKIDDIEFLKNLEQYDILLSSAEKADDVKSINKAIISSYQEMVNNN